MTDENSARTTRANPFAYAVTASGVGLAAAAGALITGAPSEVVIGIATASGSIGAVSGGFSGLEYLRLRSNQQNREVADDDE